MDWSPGLNQKGQRRGRWAPASIHSLLPEGRGNMARYLQLLPLWLPTTVDYIL